MKCTDKKTRKHVKNRACAFALAVLCSVSCCGCGASYELEHAYDVYGTQIDYPKPAFLTLNTDSEADSTVYFAQDLCVGEDTTLGTEYTDSQAAEAAGVFHLASGDITYSKNIYKKLYPASTTKILTAYIALKYGNLSDVVTVSEKAATQASDSSVCNIRAGDKITLEELLYGLLLKSGNDAADAVAEHISGDTGKFAELMNQEAAAIGASNSHFANPHGLQDENHYTCVYDLYLLFQAALEYEEFQKIIHTPQHTAAYQNAEGLLVTQEWQTTDRYLNGEAEAPEGITVVGGKTGTTSDAGYCLVLYSENEEKEPVISIVLKADSRNNLYLLMSELLKC